MKILRLLLLAALLATPVCAGELTKLQSGKIAEVVGKLLAQAHYRQMPLDDSVSEQFLKSYFDALDFNHMVFLQTDLDEFTKRYGAKLDDAINGRDTSPGFEIYDRYLQRLNERNQFVQKRLKGPFDFTTDESFLISRNKAPWPKDRAEADELWQARVKWDLLQGKLAKEKPEETLKLVTKRYNRLVKNMTELDSEEILQIYLTALAHVYDPHSDYMTPTEAANFSIQNVKLKLSGIGALLRSEDGFARIENLVPGGPAAMSKQLKPKDRIVAVAQGDDEAVDSVDMKLNKVVEMIRGKQGTVVKLTIVPANSPDGSVKKIVTLVRDEIKLTEQYAKAKIYDHLDETGRPVRLGVINLPQFYENCASDVEKLIERLAKEHVSALVLDLRHNGGGILQEAIALTGLFIKKGPVVQVKDSRKEVRVLGDDNPKLAYDGPLVVLVSRFSASASEIVAAALQDYERAIVVGDQSTHGKGTVQTLQSLNPWIKNGLVADAGQLKFTIQKFYRIAGGTTQKYGVTPDLVLPSATDYMELGEALLPNCLEADSTPPQTYEHFGRVKPYLAELDKRSKERIARNVDFTYVNEDIEQLKKQRADKTVSLNEAKRVQEKKEQKAKLEARKEERKKRPATGEQVFDLTLEMVDKNLPLQPVLAKGKDGEGSAATNSTPKVAASDKGKPDVLVAANDAKDPATQDADGEDAADAVDTTPAIDVHLNEGLNITGDYLAAMEKMTLKSLSNTSAK
ncbi:MAG: carboxy terminal-processing peptidase [Verrucomicrobia bacterium]|nr:carboxy terminal-processing peptidase [Verrucomicrobiota bacterium]